MLDTVSINYIAVLVAALSNFAVGFIWYGPFLGKPWMNMVGLTEEQMNSMQGAMMAKIFGLSFVGALVMAFIMAHWVGIVDAITWMEGLESGFWAWLGFVAPPFLMNNLYERKPLALWGINTGYWLVSLLIMGVLFALWT